MTKDMKHLLLGVLLFFSSIACFGQDDATEQCYPVGTTWEEGLLLSETEELEVKHLHTVIGDTLINDVSYKIVKREWLDGSTSQQYTESKTYFIREDNGRVYYLGKNNENTRTYADITYDGTETLRYDFNWSDGGMDESRLAKVEQLVLEDGKAYDYEPSGKIIRTIGNIQGGLILSWMRQSRSEKTVLLSFTRGDVLIYMKDYPSINGIKQFENEPTPNPSLLGREYVYDLSGRIIENRKLPKGIYIQNGRKFVVK